MSCLLTCSNMKTPGKSKPGTIRIYTGNLVRAMISDRVLPYKPRLWKTVVTLGSEGLGFEGTGSIVFLPHY